MVLYKEIPACKFEFLSLNTKYMRNLRKRTAKFHLHLLFNGKSMVSILKSSLNLDKDKKIISNKNAFQYNAYRPQQQPSVGGCLLLGGLVLGGACSGGVPAPVWLVLGVGYIQACTEADPPPCGQTDTCKNITFTTSLQTVTNLCLSRKTHFRDEGHQPQKGEENGQGERSTSKIVLCGSATD